MSRLVYGVRPVGELLRRRASEIQSLWLAAERNAAAEPIQALRGVAEAQGLAPQIVPREQLDALCGGESHQGVAAIVCDFDYVDLEDLVPAGATPAPLIIAVDGVTDPQNLGAMFRAGAVLGATGIVLTKDRCASVSPAVVRVSSGATEHLPCARVTNLTRALERLKELGVWVAGTVERGGQAPADVDLAGPLALVLGSEERGMRPGVAKACDYRLTIPTPGAMAALNVASATAILIYEAARQRRRQSAG
ncbi:MAG: 23S rRNA (guanosine(2251)-2'-O)-methyltransferase RlmB [Proteobacteria bacterium]|nr:23S rRNA (guanosine(2251)-2'-O)-methyltransferase RlmB [Pseudomonadota bacterium]